MSWKTFRVTQKVLYDPGYEESIPVGSPAWYTWLAHVDHHSFHFDDPTGGFTARKESKQHGQSYWIAYRQVHRKLYKVYLGKSEALSEECLHNATHALTCLAATAELVPTHTCHGS